MPEKSWNPINWIIDFIKAISPFHALILLIICLTIILLPNNLAEYLAISEFRINYKTIIGIIIIVCSIFLICHLLRFVFLKLKTKIGDWIKINKLEKEISNILESLSYQEKLILAFCLRINSLTMYAPLGNPVILGLCSKGIMEQASGTGLPWAWTYTIERNIWNLLKKKSSLFPEFKDFTDANFKAEITKIIKPLLS